MSANARWLLWLPLLALLGWLVATDEREPLGVELATLQPRRAADGASMPVRPAAAVATQTVRELVPREQLVPRRAASAVTHDLFLARPWVAPLPPAPRVAAPATLPAPAAPVPELEPEPAPYTYLGKQHDDKGWRVYLGRGDAAVIAREGDALEDGWRVVSIRPPTLTLARGELAPQQIAIGDWE